MSGNGAALSTDSGSNALAGVPDLPRTPAANGQQEYRR
jgi:hypothetical protein